MAKTKKMTKVVIVIGAMAGVAAGVLGAGYMLFGNIGFKDLRSKLLRDSDPNALLAASRELSARVLSGKLEAGSYCVRFWPDREVSGFPETIRSLSPNFVYISRTGTVKISMTTKLLTFGVIAYPPGDDEEHFPNSSFGDRKLIEGLWYYDENYHRYNHSDYDHEIDAIIGAARESRSGGTSGGRQ
jgi:hypothetical protein